MKFEENMLDIDKIRRPGECEFQKFDGGWVIVGKKVQQTGEEKHL